MDANIFGARIMLSSYAVEKYSPISQTAPNTKQTNPQSHPVALKWLRKPNRNASPKQEKQTAPNLLKTKATRHQNSKHQWLTTHKNRISLEKMIIFEGEIYIFVCELTISKPQQANYIMNETNDTVEAPKQPTEDLPGLQQQLETEKKRSEDYLTRLKYLQADFENLRNRCDRQIKQVIDYSNERLLIQLLEVVDELELAVKNAQATDCAPNLIEGVQMTLKRLRKVLEQEGVTPIESKDKPFDPSKHNAIAVEERDDAENCVVTEEMRKGYVMKEKVLRPSIVKVVRKKVTVTNNGEKENESS
jgi:molecular chaperone GrpE